LKGKGALNLDLKSQRLSFSCHAVLFCCFFVAIAHAQKLAALKKGSIDLDRLEWSRVFLIYKEHEQFKIQGVALLF